MTRQQQKRGDCNSPPHLIQHAGVSPKFPGRERGDYFNSGGFESRSSRVWSKEKDRGGASPPVGKSSSSLLDCQNLVLKNPTLPHIYMYALKVVLIQFYYESCVIVEVQG